jgi:hypothetical protein
LLTGGDDDWEDLLVNSMVRENNLECIFRYKYSKS